MITGTASSVVLGLLLATSFACAFHVLLGGSIRRLFVYILAAWLGFIAGHFAGSILEIDLLQLGRLQLLAASMGAWLALLLSRWLAGKSN
jgi:hypothetical protein